MDRFDTLPPELRTWMAQAVLPWSPTSCLRIWRKARPEEEGIAKALARLEAAESRMLAQDNFAGSAADRRSS